VAKTSERANVWAIVNSVIAVAALVISVAIARGVITPPDATLRSTWEGHEVSAFGTACRTNRGSDCLRQWSYSFATSRVKDGKFTAELAWSFGGASMIEGEVHGATLMFKETAVSRPLANQTIYLCTYRLVLDNATELHGTWNTCVHPDDGSGVGDEGSILLNFDTN
jgi:hypothetical protein